MPIDTSMEGNPDSIRQAANWLKSSLQAGIHDCASQVYRARTRAESGWHGDASSAFQDKMTNAARGSDVVATDSGALAQSFESYAADLHTAQAGMERAKEIAQQGGLKINGAVIEDPGAAPTTPQELPTDGSLTSEQIQQNHQAVQAVADHQRKVAAFNAARAEADRANGILNNAEKVAEEYWRDLSGKTYIHATDFTNAAAGELIKMNKSILKKESARLLDESKTAETRYLNSSGGSPEAKFQEELRLSKTMAASELESEAVTIGRRFASKIPIIGWGIAAAGIGYDIHDGKPPGKAIFSGVAGTLGAMAVTAAVPGVGWAAAAGIGVGILVGIGADWVYDNVLPNNVKHKIDDGLNAVGHTIASAGDTVGHVFSSIF